MAPEGVSRSTSRRSSSKTSVPAGTPTTAAHAAAQGSGAFASTATTTSRSVTSTTHSGNAASSTPASSQLKGSPVIGTPGSRRESAANSLPRPLQEVLPQNDQPTTHVPDAGTHSRRSSAGREKTSGAHGTEVASAQVHHRQSSSTAAHRDKSMATVSHNAQGPAPVPSAHEQATAARATARGSNRSRTTIPAATGSWILGKTIGQGSMGKVKLARKSEGGEQVAVKIVPRGSTEHDPNQSRADRERADHSKEVRTAREAAIVTLLDHPYICGMVDVVRTTYHWYMLFEYVNGGQMLDYIISHGRLKEKQARKFSRQIASALDYCHRNSIVHRDLKIENILISKTGDIKIIDFGLSNLFSPKNHLKTFCGSLYFAAPELLQAKAYTGPEVDLWSFGIVLYVLVCGKVPFDDQSMPALHAKIKKGHVDYPNWLSPECKHLIGRMLVTDPKQRASLSEVMNHPWMTKGFGFAPENCLPAREPLQFPLDESVIHDMTGFDFGTPETIEAQLREVLESQEYIRAVKLAALEKENAGPPKDEKKRGFGFDFYKRRNSASRDTLTNPSTEVLPVGADPVNAFHPLISVYHLVREKQERDRQIAIPGATSMPRTPGEAPLQLPDPPKAAHTNSAAYETPGEATGGRSRPRARTHGEDEINEGIKHIKIAGTSGPNSPALIEPPAEQSQARKESTAAGILRRFSTRRKKEPEKTDMSSPPLLTVQSPEPSSLRKSFSVRRSRNRDKDSTQDAMLSGGKSHSGHSDLLSPPKTADDNASSSRGLGLGRSASVNSAEFRRRAARRADAGPPVSLRDTHPGSATPSAHDSDYSTGREKSPPREAMTRSKSTRAPIAARAKSLGHARRESIQARRARRSEAQQEARESSVVEEDSTRPTGPMHDRDTDNERDGDASGISTDRLESAENAKPVFLKGLFSVSTTSTKPVSEIRTDIIRVLKSLGVEYSEIRGGFACRHAPSIDLKKVVDPPASTAHGTPGANKSRRISFGAFMTGNLTGDKDRDRERDDVRDAERSPRTATTPRMRNDRRFSGQSYGVENESERSSESVERRAGDRAVGETSTHVQSELGGSMVLEFEIFIVKVPLLSLHGIQFKRLAGGTWQYKSMADHVLKELRL